MSQQLTLHQAFASAAKAISNPPSIPPDPKKKQLLRKKRNLEIIERNYLIRRFYYPIKQNSEYEIEAKTYGILNHFDFDSSPYNKFSSIKNISANAFWFLLCSNYFPYYSNELIDQKECIPEELKKLIDYINNNNSIKKISTNFGEKFNFLRNLKNIVNNFVKKKITYNEKNNLFQTTNINTSLKSNNINNSNTINLNENKSNINLTNLSCTNTISSIKSLLENLIKYFENQNENIPNKIKNDYLLTKNYNRDIRVDEDFELDIKFHTKSFKRFREEILDKVEQNEEDENDDIVCYVCGDGEYEDDNLILYCSKCNMTVHQKCYGVLVIPDEDWICHLCKAFNDIKYCNNMECILCPNLGGAMKPCTLRKSSHSYKIMIKNRKYPFLKDNINKNNNLNNNLINSISDENKDNKNIDNKINNNLKNESNAHNNPENNLFISDINNFNSNTKSLVPPNSNSILNIIDNNINSNENNNNHINNDLNSNSHNNNILTNSPNNNSNHSNNSNNENNINAIQNNIMEASCRSSNINKDTDSLISNISSNKINIKEDNENNNNNNKNQINNNINKNILKKQSQKSKSQNEIYLSEKIANENAWVHLSCALWLPELILANFDLKEKIKGVENLPKKRLLEQCNICLKSGYGPTIKCEKCDYHFHPECARRLKNFFLEINENENGETTFLAYCNKDAPPQHLKKYELIRQRKRDDIKKFSSLLQKDISSLNKISDDKQYNIYHPYCYNTNNIEMKKIISEEKKIIKKIGKSNNSIENHNNFLYNKDFLYNETTKKSINSNTYNFDKGIELSISEKKSLLNAIREMLIDQSNLTLEINTNDYSIKSSNNNIKLTYDDLQYPEKFSWRFLKESQYYLNGISNYETFKIFQSLVPNKIDYAKNILKEKIMIPEKQKKHKNKIKQKKKMKDEKNIKYCICNKNENFNWVGCENENGKCPGKGWYHIGCIPELKGYNIDTFTNYFEHYYCPECRKLFKFENEIKKGNEVNEINVELNPEENNSIDINIENKEKSNSKLELKKQESNVVECVNIDNHEEKLEEKDNNNINMNNNINNNAKLPMEIEEKIKEETKEKKEVKIN